MDDVHEHIGEWRRLERQLDWVLIGTRKGIIASRHMEMRIPVNLVWMEHVVVWRYLTVNNNIGWDQRKSRRFWQPEPFQSHAVTPPPPKYALYIIITLCKNMENEWIRRDLYNFKVRMGSNDFRCLKMTLITFKLWNLFSKAGPIIDSVCISALGGAIIKITIHGIEVTLQARCHRTKYNIYFRVYIGAKRHISPVTNDDNWGADIVSGTSYCEGRLMASSTRRSSGGDRYP